MRYIFEAGRHIAEKLREKGMPKHEFEVLVRETMREERSRRHAAAHERIDVDIELEAGAILNQELAELIELFEVQDEINRRLPPEKANGLRWAVKVMRDRLARGG